MSAKKTTGKASPKTSISDLGSGLAEAYTSRMAERVERYGLLSEEQRAVLKIDEEKTGGPKLILPAGEGQ